MNIKLTIKGSKVTGQGVGRAGCSHKKTTFCILKETSIAKEYQEHVLWAWLINGNLLRWSFFTLIYNRSSNKCIISYIIHIISLLTGK